MHRGHSTLHFLPVRKVIKDPTNGKIYKKRTETNLVIEIAYTRLGKDSTQLFQRHEACSIDFLCRPCPIPTYSVVLRFSRPEGAPSWEHMPRHIFYASFSFFDLLLEMEWFIVHSFEKVPQYFSPIDYSSLEEKPSQEEYVANKPYVEVDGISGK